MTKLNKALKKNIDFEEKTKTADKSKTILIEEKNKDIKITVITKRSL